MIIKESTDLFKFNEFFEDKNSYNEDKFFTEDFAREIWEDSYRHDNEQIHETQERLVNTIFEKEQYYYKQLFALSLFNRRISLGGRVVANTGIGLKNANSFNCYSAQRSVKPVDSIKNIYNDLWIAAEILKTEGGIGYDFSHIRPKRTFIKGIGSAHPGVVEFMTLYDKSAEIVTKSAQGNIFQHDKKKDVTKKKIRKGAQIALLRCEHPEIFDYIESKTIANKFSKFNISVSITDKFMHTMFENKSKKFAFLDTGKEVEYDGEQPSNAVYTRKGGEWVLWFPNIRFEKYDEEWNGDFEDWKTKYPKEIVVYEKVPAKKVWDSIITTSYNTNDPGLFFIDNANKFNNLIYYQKYVATNPCGEITMQSDPGRVWFELANMKGNWSKVKSDNLNYEVKHHGDICNLGHLNLTGYVKKVRNSTLGFDVEDTFGFDFDLFKNDIAILTRALDNLIDVSGYPMPEIANSAKLRRKIGMGILGYGSMLYMMGLRYGSKAANQLTEKISIVYANTAYMTSALLAKEKGVFPLYSKEIINNGFIANSGILEEETITAIKLYGLRNSALLTSAPTGQSGVYMNVVSGGEEPVFDKEYNRWVIVNHKAEKIDLVMPDYMKGEFVETKDFKLQVEGKDEVLVSKCGNYKIDKNRGLVKKVKCMDFGWKWAKENYSPEKFKELEKQGVFVSAMELTVKEHLDPFIIFSKGIDQSVSKTINLKNDYPLEDFDEMFVNLWKSGARGMTTYREGTMASVLETGQIKSEQEEFFDMWNQHKKGVVMEDVNLPTEYPMMGHVIRSEGKKWYFHVAFKDQKMKSPFAIFVQTNHTESDVNTENSVELLYELARKEKIPEKHIQESEHKMSGRNNVTKITRTVGLLLRHNVKIEKIVNTLNKVEVSVSSFVYTLKKFLMKYIESGTISSDVSCPNCGGTIHFEDGCLLCKDCGYSVC